MIFPSMNLVAVRRRRRHPLVKWIGAPYLLLMAFESNLAVLNPCCVALHSYADVGVSE